MFLIPRFLLSFSYTLKFHQFGIFSIKKTKEHNDNKVNKLHNCNVNNYYK